MANKTKRKFKKGRFNPRFPDKYKGDLKNIIFRSGWELQFMQYLDTNKNITKWASEPFHIDYIFSVDKKKHRYYPDFLVEYIDINKVKHVDLIEIKPYKETIKPKSNKNKKTLLIESFTYQKNQDKWKYAEEYCRKHNMTFKIFTEYELGIKKKYKGKK